MPFPTSFPDQGTSSLIGWLRGKEIPAAVALEGAYDLAGFALGQMVQKPPASPGRAVLLSEPLDKGKLADELEGEFYASGKLKAAPAFAFDWVAVLAKIQKLLPIIISLLS